MSRHLVESILSGNMLEANDMVEAKMAEIRERKMYEMKRMYATKLDEMGPFNYKQRYADLKAKGAKRASDVWGDEAKAKSGAKDSETPQRRKRPPGGTEKDPYAGKGNMPHIMAARLGRHIAKKAGDLKKAVSDYKPDAPGTAVVKTTKAVAKGAGTFTKRLGTNLTSGPIAQDVKSIAFRNL